MPPRTDRSRRSRDYHRPAPLSPDLHRHGRRGSGSARRSGRGAQPLPGGPRRRRMVLLLLAAALSIYKPRGMTRYGWRRRQQERDGNRPATARTVTESRERPHGLPTHRIREPVARFGLAGGDGDRGWLTPERDRDRLRRPSAAPTPSPERRSTAPRPQFEAPASGRLVADRVASGLGRTRGRI